MCNIKIRVMAVLRMWLTFTAVAVMLCGCTRKEQLVLETRGAESLAAEQEQTLLLQETGQEQTAGERGLAGSGQTAHPEEGTWQGVQADQKEQADAWNGTSENGPSRQDETADEQTARICVHVCGAVRKAGVYELPSGSRVYEAVEKAGGFAENADQSYVNQAQQLSDGAKLVIPTLEQVQKASEDPLADTGGIGIVEQSVVGSSDGPGAAAGKESGTAQMNPAVRPDGKININTATEAQLCEIPGIGATRAAAIAAYRQEHGNFTSIEEIMRVNGIKEGTYEKMKDSITVN